MEVENLGQVQPDRSDERESEILHLLYRVRRAMVRNRGRAKEPEQGDGKVHGYYKAEPLEWKPWMADFVEKLRQTGNATQAIADSPFSGGWVYAHKNRCPRFHREWEAAKDDYRRRFKNDIPAPAYVASGSR